MFHEIAEVMWANRAFLNRRLLQKPLSRIFQVTNKMMIARVLLTEDVVKPVDRVERLFNSSEFSVSLYHRGNEQRQMERFDWYLVNLWILFGPFFPCAETVVVRCHGVHSQRFRDEQRNRCTKLTQPWIGCFFHASR